jgi:hypothetical protein
LNVGYPAPNGNQGVSGLTIPQALLLRADEVIQ